MARYEAGHAAAARDRIVEGASVMIRERGLDGASVAEVMKASGLTVGGFYAHFDDKADMLARAMAVAIEASEGRFRFLAAKAMEAADPGLIARRYLADERVEKLGEGCAAAALASEMHRAPDAVREAFVAGATASATALNPVFPDAAPGPAWAAYALLVGSLALMRASDDPALRAAMREAAEQGLRALAPGPDRAADQPWDRPFSLRP